MVTVNDDEPGVAMRRPDFDDLTPIFPYERISLESSSRDLSLRLIDLVAPIGKGQRGLIVAPPKAGKTVLLKKVAAAIQKSYPDIEMIVLLVDERPEEVTDMKHSLGDSGEVIYSTFDEMPQHHVKVSEMVLARAQRLVEHGRDVVILLDSITRLARAYNLTVQASGRQCQLHPQAPKMIKVEKKRNVTHATVEGNTYVLIDEFQAVLHTMYRMLEKNIKEPESVTPRDLMHSMVEDVVQKEKEMR